MQLLTDLVARGTHVLVCDPERVRTRAADLVRTAEEFLAASWSTAAEAGQAPIDLGASSFRDLAEVETAARIRGLPWWTTGRVHPRRPRTTTSTSPSTPTTVDRFSGDVPRADRAGAHAGPARAGGSSSPSPGPGPAQRAADQFAEADLGVRLVPDIAAAPGRRARLRHPGQPGVRVRLPRRRAGAAHRARPDRPARHHMRDAAKMPARRRNAVDLVQLQPGDLVVHEQHGIGRYIEMISRTVNGGQRDYLIVEYAPSRRNQPPDRLFVPDRLPRPADPLRRRRGAGAVQARRRRLEEHQEQGAQGGQADRRRADPALLRADGDARATPSARTPSGSASSRTPSRSRRRPTSSAPSTRSRPT